MNAIAPEPLLFPRLSAVVSALRQLSRGVWEPAGKSPAERIRVLEAKVEYLLNELYRIKSIQRFTPVPVNLLASLRDYQVSSFDYQWGDIIYHDQFLSNPAWRERAPQDACERIEVEPSWFTGRKVLDCGCGPGRHTFAFASMGAEVVAFDLAERALEAARQACVNFLRVTIESRNILEPLPYPKDFDLVWCYGVLHHIGDTTLGLRNISQHVKPGGRIYLMLYAEPRRDNVCDYQYQHEIATIREATRNLPFAEKAKVCEQIEGPLQTLAWFDAISSEINDLYTFEEIAAHLTTLGFTNIRKRPVLTVLTARGAG